MRFKYNETFILNDAIKDMGIEVPTDGKYSQEILSKIEKIKITNACLSNLDFLIALPNLNELIITNYDYQNVADYFSYNESPGFNNIKSYAALYKLKNLKKLHIDNELNIKKIDFTQLTNLEQIEINNNPNLTTLIGLEYLHKLKRVTMYGNHITHTSGFMEYLINTIDTETNVVDLSILLEYLKNESIRQKIKEMNFMGLIHIIFSEKNGQVDHYDIATYQIIDMYEKYLKEFEKKGLLKHNITREEKIDYTFKYIINNISFAEEVLQKRKELYSELIKPQYGSIPNFYKNYFGAMHSAIYADFFKKANCEGMVNLMKFLLNILDIDSEVVHCSDKQHNSITLNHAILRTTYNDKQLYFDPAYCSVYKTDYYGYLKYNEASKYLNLSYFEKSTVYRETLKKYSDYFLDDEYTTKKDESTKYLEENENKTIEKYRLKTIKTKKILYSILTNLDNYPILQKEIIKIAPEYLTKFTSKINNLNNRSFYDSPIHGVYHSEKVALFCFLLGTKLGCNEKEIEILTDAGLYHDFMRNNDISDSIHGLSAAQNIQKVVDLGKYNKAEQQMLRTIIDYHSTIISFDIISDNYDVPEEQKQRCLFLANILKDADALDRKRFSDNSLAALNPKYLNYKESLEFIKLSETINNYYKEISISDEELLSSEYLFKYKSKCCHSIGQNIFKLLSVLTNGILSSAELAKIDHNFKRNFAGGNCEKWISVVPINLVDFRKKQSATNEFLTNGITFITEDIDLYCSHPQITTSYAQSFGLPYKFGQGYPDERYAFKKIPKEKIVGIFVSNLIANKDLNELENYVYVSFDYDLFESNVLFYFKQMGIENLEQLPDEFKRDMELYKQICEEVTNFGDTKEVSLRKSEYAKTIVEVANRINLKIGSYLHNYFSNKLGKKSSVVTFNDAIKYQLSRSNCDFELLEDSNLYYFLTPKQYQKDQSTGIKLK